MMENKQVIEKSKDLQRATTEDASSEHIIKILNELKSGINASEDLLRSTKIGVIVNRSKTHKDPKVARLAMEIVRKWRDDIEKQKGSASPANGKLVSPSRTASPMPTNGLKTKKEVKSEVKTEVKPESKSGVAPEQRNYEKDKVNVKKTNQETRDRCIGLIYNGLCYGSLRAPSEILSMAVAIEAAGYSILGPESNAGYSMKMRSLYMNLKNKSNPQLRESVLMGEIAPERLVKMSTEDMKSKERQDADKALMDENMKEAQMPQAERSISTAIQCKNPKCGKDTVAYTQAQTRSADEPMTTFCECQSCGRRWKFS